MKPRGYVLGAVAAASYGTNPLFALPLYDAGMDTDSVLLLRYSMAVPIMGLMARWRGQSLRVTPAALAWLAVLGVVQGVSSLTLFLSFRHMDAGIASTLLFVYPLMVAAIMAAFCRERLSWFTYGCMAVALAGIALLYKGADGATLSLAGTALVMASALCYAIYLVRVNFPPLLGVPTLTVTFYVMAFGTLFYASRLCLAGTATMPGQWWMWGNVLALAVVPTAISYSCTTMSIQMIGSTPTAILGALEPLTAVLLGMAVFGERLTARDWLGLALIIAAVTLVVVQGRVAPALLRFRKLFPRLRHRPWQISDTHKA